MPEISRFFGIAIYIYFNDHNPPHFHAKYGKYEILVSLKGEILEGKFPAKAQNFVLRWLEINKEKLKENWKRAQKKKKLLKIKPLK